MLDDGVYVGVGFGLEEQCRKSDSLHHGCSNDEISHKNYFKSNARKISAQWIQSTTRDAVIYESAPLLMILDQESCEHKKHLQQSQRGPMGSRRATFIALSRSEDADIFGNRLAAATFIDRRHVQ